MPFQCSDCNKTFESKIKLSKHRYIHSLPQHECHVCSKRFHFPSKLKQHLRIHGGQTNHLCQECGKGFSFPCNLERHIRTVHNNLKEFKCNDCHETFGKKETLIAHQQTHTGVAPFKCSRCQKGFKYEHNMKRHSCKPARDIPPFKCEECRKEFMNKKSLRQHVLKHKEPTYSCHICGIPFTWRSGLSNHLKSCDK